MGRRPRRYFFFFLTILIGFAIGVIYGWEINPVVYKHTGIKSLRMDYKTDYVLMVAECYQSEGDVVMALARLAYLDSTSPLALVTTTINYAENSDYANNDLQLMWNLASSIDSALKVSD